MSDEKESGSSDHIYTIVQREAVEQETQFEVRAPSRPHAYALLLSHLKNSRQDNTEALTQVGARIRRRTPLGQPTTLVTRPAVPPIVPVVSTESKSESVATELKSAPKREFPWPFKPKAAAALETPDD